MGKKKRAAVADPAAETRSWSIGDAGLAEYFGLPSTTAAGVSVSELAAFGLTAFWRAVAIISGTVAGLPLKSYRTLEDGTRERVSTFLDDPGRMTPLAPTPFEWVELVLVHLLVHGNAYLRHHYNGAGAIIGLEPIHPDCVKVTIEDDGTKLFTITFKGGSRQEFTPLDVTHIPGMGVDGVTGLAPVAVLRQALGTAIAGDQAAARMFGNGLLLGGLITPKEPLEKEDAEALLASLKAKMVGVRNAGDLAFLNTDLSFSQWTSTAEDGQFIESRQFMISEVCRITGVPKVLLAEDGASTWGAGIAELNRGFAKYTLMGHTSRIEARLSRLLSRPTFCEFDYAGLLQGTPEVELDMLIKQKEAEILTADEIRRIRNLPPLPAGEAVEEEEESVAVG